MVPSNCRTVLFSGWVIAIGRADGLKPDSNPAIFTMTPTSTPALFAALCSSWRCSLQRSSILAIRLSPGHRWSDRSHCIRGYIPFWASNKIVLLSNVTFPRLRCTTIGYIPATTAPCGSISTVLRSSPEASVVCGICAISLNAPPNRDQQHVLFSATPCQRPPSAKASHRLTARPSPVRHHGTRSRRLVPRRSPRWRQCRPSHHRSSKRLPSTH